MLDGRVPAEIKGIELEGRIFIGETTSIDSLEMVEGPAFIGNYAKIDPKARMGLYYWCCNDVVVKGENSPDAPASSTGTAARRYRRTDRRQFVGGQEHRHQSGVTLSEVAMAATP